ncbi:MAG: ferredoxin [Thermoplasmataceae archaeon]|nr:ferredoxin [Candidatus Thermoplasmatota archaeon]
MAGYKISLDRKGCLSDAICTALCPSNWFMDSDGKASFKNEVIGENELEDNMEASRSCPTGIIRISKIEQTS